MTVLYVHGMGGGADSRIPSLLRWHFARGLSLPDGSTVPVDIVCRTYSFDPSISEKELRDWCAELKPELVIGESLGACRALKIKGVPKIFVSPSLGGPLWLGRLAFLSLIPGVPALMSIIYKPREGRRQTLDFHFRVLRRFRKLYSEAIATGISDNSFKFAFVGERDKYRRSGVVCLRRWKKHFGKDSVQTYDGSHFMEEEYVSSLLVPKMSEILLNLVPRT